MLKKLNNILLIAGVVFLTGCGQTHPTLKTAPYNFAYKQKQNKDFTDEQFKSFLAKNFRVKIEKPKTNKEKEEKNIYYKTLEEQGLIK